MYMRLRNVLKVLVVMVGIVFIGTGCAGDNNETVLVEATSEESTTMSEEATTESISETVAETVTKT